MGAVEVVAVRTAIRQVRGDHFSALGIELGEGECACFHDGLDRPEINACHLFWGDEMAEFDDYRLEVFQARQLARVQAVAEKHGLSPLLVMAVYGLVTGFRLAEAEGADVAELSRRLNVVMEEVELPWKLSATLLD